MKLSEQRLKEVLEARDGSRGRTLLACPLTVNLNHKVKRPNTIKGRRIRAFAYLDKL